MLTDVIADKTAPEPDALQRLVRDRLAELGDSTRNAAKRSHGLVSHTVLSRIAAGSYRGKRLQSNTLAGVALALNLAESEVYAAAEAALRPTRWVTLSGEFSRLDTEGQAQAVAAMEAIIEAYEQRERERARKDRPFG